MWPMARVLLAGAGGFVGRWLWPALCVDGCEVRCLTRDAAAARRRLPDRGWVEGDPGSRTAMRRALEGCSAAYFLIPAGVRAAEAFAAAAADARVERIVYLGAIAPTEAALASADLRRRLEAGAALRAGNVPTVELRAGLIVGQGNPAWLALRDLAARLPFMLLPRWLDAAHEPVAIRDVVAALVGALRVPLDRAGLWDLPGPRAMTVRGILDETAAALGRAPPRAVAVPVGAPWLSAGWVRLVTRARWAAARDLVLTLGAGQVARDASYWELIGHPRQDFAAAARAAVETEAAVGGLWGALERRLGERA
jgi:uncharacterized protein YbjT (DUF2867 family)